jgi:hypothetical protein
LLVDACGFFPFALKGFSTLNLVFPLCFDLVFFVVYPPLFTIYSRARSKKGTMNVEKRRKEREKHKGV